MKHSTALAIGLGLALLLAGFAAVCAMGYVLVTGPRMRTQPNVRAYQAEVPPLPEGVVPVDPPDTSPPGRIPEAGAAAQLVNPLASTEDNRARGEVYYKYYCAFCHGEQGDGNGPVGQSYVPRPADLCGPKVQGYSDGEILRTMLTGEGHEPVLGRVVPTEHRWPLVLYVRALGSTKPQ